MLRQTVDPRIDPHHLAAGQQAADAQTNRSLLNVSAQQPRRADYRSGKYQGIQDDGIKSEIGTGPYGAAAARSGGLVWEGGPNVGVPGALGEGGPNVGVPGALGEGGPNVGVPGASGVGSGSTGSVGDETNGYMDWLSRGVGNVAGGLGTMAGWAGDAMGRGKAFITDQAQARASAPVGNARYIGHFGEDTYHKRQAEAAAQVLEGLAEDRAADRLRGSEEHSLEVLRELAARNKFGQRTREKVAAAERRQFTHSQLDRDIEEGDRVVNALKAEGLLNEGERLYRGMAWVEAHEKVLAAAKLSQTPKITEWLKKTNHAVKYMQEYDLWRDNRANNWPMEYRNMVKIVDLSEKQSKGAHPIFQDIASEVMRQTDLDYDKWRQNLYQLIKAEPFDEPSHTLRNLMINGQQAAREELWNLAYVLLGLVLEILYNTPNQMEKFNRAFGSKAKAKEQIEILRGNVEAMREEAGIKLEPSHEEQEAILARGDARAAETPTLLDLDPKVRAAIRAAGGEQQLAQYDSTSEMVRKADWVSREDLERMRGGKIRKKLTRKKYNTKRRKKTKRKVTKRKKLNSRKKIYKVKKRNVTKRKKTKRK
jgi:hypothetical protein